MLGQAEDQGGLPPKKPKKCPKKSSTSKTTSSGVTYCPVGCGKIYSGKTSAWYVHWAKCTGDPNQRWQNGSSQQMVKSRYLNLVMVKEPLFLWSLFRSSNLNQFLLLIAGVAISRTVPLKGMRGWMQISILCISRLPNKVRCLGWSCFTVDSHSSQETEMQKRACKWTSELYQAHNPCWTRLVLSNLNLRLVIVSLWGFTCCGSLRK